MTRCLASLRRVRLVVVPRIHRYYQDTMTSCRPSRVTSLPSFGGTTRCTLFALASECDSCKPGVLLTRYSFRGISCGDDRISQVPGQPQLSVCSCSSTPARWFAPDLVTLGASVFGATTWPLLRERQRLSQNENLRSSITWLSDWLSTLRHVRYLTQRKTRFRPLVRRYRTGFPPAGSQSKVSNSRHVNPPPPPSFLAQSRSVSSRSGRTLESRHFVDLSADHCWRNRKIACPHPGPKTLKFPSVGDFAWRCSASPLTHRRHGKESCESPGRTMLHARGQAWPSH